MTPDEVAARAMGRLSADLRTLHCPLRRYEPCGNCGYCTSRKEAMAEYHRLAALYPKSVPDTAPPEVKVAVHAWGHR